MMVLGSSPRVLKTIDTEVDPLARGDLFLAVDIIQGPKILSTRETKNDCKSWRYRRSYIST